MAKVVGKVWKPGARQASFSSARLGLLPLPAAICRGADPSQGTCCDFPPLSTHSLQLEQSQEGSRIYQGLLGFQMVDWAGLGIIESPLPLVRPERVTP